MKNHLEHLQSGQADNSSIAELQLRALWGYFDENPILALPSVGLSWLSLRALIILLGIQGAAAHHSPVGRLFC